MNEEIRTGFIVPMLRHELGHYIVASVNNVPALGFEVIISEKGPFGATTVARTDMIMITSGYDRSEYITKVQIAFAGAVAESLDIQKNSCITSQTRVLLALNANGKNDKEVIAESIKIILKYDNIPQNEIEQKFRTLLDLFLEESIEFIQRHGLLIETIAQTLSRDIENFSTSYYFDTERLDGLIEECQLVTDKTFSFGIRF